MRIAVIGAGIAGLSTAWSLVKRGEDVTLFDQADILNPLSASGDQHRLIRRAYGGLDGYARQITEAFDGWDELWADLGQSFYENRGVIAINQYPNDLGLAFANSMRRGNYRFDTMTPAEAAARYPFLDPASFREAYYSPEGGVLLCQKIGNALAGWLRSHGASLQPFTRITAADGVAGTVSLENGETLTFDRIVVTAGAWVLRLFPELADTLTVCRAVAVYVEPPDALRAAWRAAPAVQSIGGILSGYILPPSADTDLKFAAGAVRRLAHDADADRTATPAEGERLRDLFSPPLARIGDYAIKRIVTCAYTFTEDLRFFSRAFGKVLVVSPCSGHGYKFGAAIGRRVAAAVIDGDHDRLARWLRAEELPSISSAA